MFFCVVNSSYHLLVFIWAYSSASRGWLSIYWTVNDITIDSQFNHPLKDQLVPDNQAISYFTIILMDSILMVNIGIEYWRSGLLAIAYKTSKKKMDVNSSTNI